MLSLQKMVFCSLRPGNGRPEVTAVIENPLAPEFIEPYASPIRSLTPSITRRQHLFTVYLYLYKMCSLQFWFILFF